MSRKKRFLILAAIALLLLGDFLYWTVPFSFGRVIPNENWNRAQLWYYDEHFDMREILVDDALMEQILTTAEGTSVTNRPRFQTMSQPFFHLFLYSEDGYTRITIVENGDVALNPRITDQLDLYFDGGEELFAMLKGLMDQSPAVFPIVPIAG